MARRWKAYAAGVSLLLAGILAGQTRADNGNEAPSFDYYVLSFSWSPEFCADPGRAAENSRECGSARRLGFVVHGLWPAVESGQNPEACGEKKRVSRGLVHDMLPYMMNEDRIHREWQVHGTCTGLSMSGYFTGLMLARAAVQIPVQITSIAQTQTEEVSRIEAQFAGANPKFPESAFRVACQGGALTEMRVCFDRELKGRACPVSVARCDSQSVKIRR
jgi:ribonuclease T2